LSAVDVAILKWMYAGAWAPAWIQLLVAVTFLGSGWMMLPLAIGLGMRGWRAPSAAVALLLTVTAALVASTKALAGRARPCHALSWAHALPLEFPTDPSFPSGHAAGSFAFSSFVFGLNRRAGAPLLAAAALIALTRVALGVHYPSDVAAGAALGAALGTLSAKRYRRWRAAEWPAISAAP
jgi:undecaprenyl-diphosphatase